MLSVGFSYHKQSSARMILEQLPHRERSPAEYPQDLWRDTSIIFENGRALASRRCPGNRDRSEWP